MVVKMVEVAKVEMNIVIAAKIHAFMRMMTPPAMRLGSCPARRTFAKAACKSAAGRLAISREVE